LRTRSGRSFTSTLKPSGGDCIDAVIATTFALSVQAPWMSVRDALRSDSAYGEAPVQSFPMKFVCPDVVLRDGSINSGAVEIAHPWGDAVAER
jgi:hypothetical protein